MQSTPADASPSTESKRRLRIDGLDLARAIAILGMVGSHTGHERTPGEEGGWAWLAITGGYPSALFAVLAGVSMTLMATNRATVAVSSVDGRDLTHTRVRIAMRAVILIVLGWAMMALGTPVAVILGNLGVMFLLALPMLRWRVGTLLAGALVAAVGGGWLAGVASEQTGGGEWPVLGELWSEHYPALAWMAYIMVGLAVGRANLRSAASALQLLGLGIVVAVSVRLAGIALRETLTDPDDAAREQWLTSEAHSYTPVEMGENIGVACAVIGAALLLASRWPRALWPLTAAGSMALTLYVAHLIVIAIVGDEMVWESSNVAFVVLASSLVAFACVWKAVLGQGPLERLLTAASSAAAFPWAVPAQAGRSSTDS